MITLPLDLQSFLARETYAMVSLGTSDGAVLVAKAPRIEINSFRGRKQILVRYELHAHPCGPVLRLLLTVYDRPGSQVSFETFCNVADPTQLDEWQDLLSRPFLWVLFFDEAGRHCLTKGVTQPQDTAVEQLIPEALRTLACTDPARYDFDRAKAAIMDENPL